MSASRARAAMNKNRKPSSVRKQAPTPRGRTNHRNASAKPTNARITTDSNRFTVTGEMYAIMDAVEVSDRFTKREFVLNITDNAKYPQLVLFQASGNGVNWLDDYAAGDSVTVSYNLRGREWTNPEGEVKYFNTLAAWKIEPAEGDAGDAGDDDDIPF